MRPTRRCSAISATRAFSFYAQGPRRQFYYQGPVADLLEFGVGESNMDGIPIVPDYACPGAPRVVFYGHRVAPLFDVVRGLGQASAVVTFIATAVRACLRSLVKSSGDRAAVRKPKINADRPNAITITAKKSSPWKSLAKYTSRNACEKQNISTIQGPSRAAIA